jgi:uncharacterized protein (TIGR02246 family)
MTYVLKLFLSFAVMATCWGGYAATEVRAADSEAVQASAETFVKAFNDAKAESVAALFLPQGELVDEEGNIYQGRDELQALFTQYFAKFPGAKLGLSIESIRMIGDDLSIEEGTRYISTDDDANAQIRYVAVRTKKDGQWLFASIREFYDDPAPSPGERISALDWIAGDWVSEDSDLAVKISYRWSEDGNFLLGDFHATKGGEVVMKTTQRLGWDPLTGNVRSWLFDSDGGFAEGTWSNVGDAWVAKSVATLPDGSTGSATVTLTQKGKDKFTMVGTERIAGGSRLDDFEVTVTRAPPAPDSKASQTNPGAPESK